jgi:hypothetical protein
MGALSERGASRAAVMTGGIVAAMLTVYPPVPRHVMESVSAAEGIWLGLALGLCFLIVTRDQTGLGLLMGLARPPAPASPTAVEVRPSTLSKP